MSFFDSVPQPPPPPEPVRRHRPVWMRSDAVIPGLVPAELMLVRTEQVAADRLRWRRRLRDRIKKAHATRLAPLPAIREPAAAAYSRGSDHEGRLPYEVVCGMTLFIGEPEAFVAIG